MDLATFFDGVLPREASVRILDIRPEMQFLAGHLPGAVSHPVGAGDVGVSAEHQFARELPSIYLPPRHEPLLVLGDDPEPARRLADHLRQRGREAVASVAVKAISRELLSAQGPSRDHLWAPPHWLVDHLEFLPPPAAGPVVDLACGNGRAAVWLAERGYRVTGLDWQPEALEFGRQLAVNRGVNVTWIKADLRRETNWPTGPWSVILNFRYLQRDLLSRFAGWLKPGGVALVRTFRAAPGYDGHPQPRHRLSAGELWGSFPAGQCEVLAYEQSFDPDGRPAAGIVARRR